MRCYGIDGILQAVGAVYRIGRCEEVVLDMPDREPNWLRVVFRIVLDWRFLLALAVLYKTLLNRYSLLLSKDPHPPRPTNSHSAYSRIAFRFKLQSGCLNRRGRYCASKPSFDGSKMVRDEPRRTMRASRSNWFSSRVTVSREVPAMFASSS